MLSRAKLISAELIFEDFSKSVIRKNQFCKINFFFKTQHAFVVITGKALDAGKSLKMWKWFESFTTVMGTVTVFRFARTIFRADLNSHVLNSRTSNRHICADTYLWIETGEIDKKLYFFKSNY